jgi:hypothetical protein
MNSSEKFYCTCTSGSRTHPFADSNTLFKLLGDHHQWTLLFVTIKPFIKFRLPQLLLLTPLIPLLRRLLRPKSLYSKLYQADFVALDCIKLYVQRASLLSRQFSYVKS